jgi:hypothetical protein
MTNSFINRAKADVSRVSVAHNAVRCSKHTKHMIIQCGKYASGLRPVSSARVTMAHFGEAVDYVQDCIIAFITFRQSQTQSILISFQGLSGTSNGVGCTGGQAVGLFSWHDTQVLHQ